jgi:hypothetical protein
MKRSAQGLEQTPQVVIHEADLAVVAIDVRAPLVRGQPAGADDLVLAPDERRSSVREAVVAPRGRVRRVGIEVVHEQVDRTLGRHALEPGDRGVGELVGGAAAELVDRRVLRLVPLQQAEDGREPRTADEGRGGVAPLAEQLGQGDRAFAEPIDLDLRSGRSLSAQPRIDGLAQAGLTGLGVEVSAVTRRVLPGEHRGVRGKRPGCRRPGALVQHPLGGEAVEDRRGVALVPVRADVVGARRVQRDHDDVRRRAATARDEQRDEQCDEQERGGRAHAGRPQRRRRVRRWRTRGARPPRRGRGRRGRDHRARQVRARAHWPHR